MARNVMTPPAWCAAMLLNAVCCLSAQAMGPMAPFAAPNGGLPEPTSAGGGLSTTQGLAGVRLGRHPGAVIDGSWVRQGQTVRGARLESISRSRVVLRYPDRHTESLDLFTAPLAPTSAGSGASSASSSQEAPLK